MAIEVVPHSPELSERVHEFNLRLHGGGSRWGFYVDPVPDWIPRRDGAPAWREYHVAVEDKQQVRGAYALKPQTWWIDGEQAWVTDWQGPFTEGAVNPRYTALGLRLLRDMLRRYPLLYSLGHGNEGQPMLRLLRSLGWTIHPTPFCFWVRKPFRFLRQSPPLRASQLRSRLVDIAAYSGAGPMGIRAAQLIRRSVRMDRDLQVSMVDSFGPWADVLWDRCRERYRCLAVRDRQMMNTILPASGWPGGTRLKVERGGQVVGWSVVLIKTMQEDARFGDLRVALIADCFGLPEDAERVLSATHEFLRASDIDLICCNLAHPRWVEALAKLGYWIVKNRREFVISPQLRERLEPFDEMVQGLHLTNMDGHGPHGFTE